MSCCVFVGGVSPALCVVADQYNISSEGYLLNVWWLYCATDNLS
jgi:hypothetical protein